MKMIMKTSGPFLLLLLLLLLLSSSTESGSVVSTSYTYIEHFSSWQEAQNYCRSHHSDLAVFNQQVVESSVAMDQYNAWIGLYRHSDKENWLWTERTFNYVIDWAPNEPESGDRCASVHYSSRRIYGHSCEEQYFFICYTQSVSDTVFIPLSKTWSEAQEFCRRQYTDLNYHPYYSSVGFTSIQDFPVWVGFLGNGLLDVSVESYGNCASISSVEKVSSSQNCSDHLPFLCADDNVLLVREERSWEEALEYCRGLPAANSSSDLVSIQPGEDHDYMMSKVLMANTEEVWVGLRFLAGDWLWVDGADVSYPDLPQCPLLWNHCGALTRDSDSSVEARDCEEKKNFLCYSLPSI